MDPQEERPDSPTPAGLTPLDAPPEVDIPAQASEQVEEEWEEETRSRGLLGLSVGLPTTILVALLMFLLGGAGGYFGRPFLSPAPPTPTPRPTSAASAAEPQQQPTADMKKLLDMLVGKTRHFEGNPNAPVVMLEFSDFQ